MSTRIKIYQTLDAAVKAEFVHVVNISDKGNQQPKGVVAFSLSDEENVTVNILDTWIPFDLTEYGSLEIIQKCNQLRSLIRTGLLALVKEESVKELRASSEYAIERAKVKERLNKSVVGPEISSTDEIEINIGASGSTIPTDIKSELREDDPNAPPKKIADISQVGHLRIQELIAANTSNNQSLVIELANKYFSLMSEIEFVHMITKIGDKGSFLGKLTAEAIGDAKQGQVSLDKLPSYQEYQNQSG